MKFELNCEFFDFCHHLPSPPRIDEYLAAAYALRLRLPPVDRDVVHRTTPNWFFKFHLLVRRNFYAYVRNLGNVVARLSTTLLVGILTGLVYEDLGTKKSNQVMSNIFGECSSC